MAEIINERRNKMAEIINEIPDEVDMEGEELEVDLDAAKKDSDGKKSTADVERVEEPKKTEPELEIEEEDEMILHLKIEAKNHYLMKLKKR
jgi:hypothetical protein